MMRRVMLAAFVVSLSVAGRAKAQLTPLPARIMPWNETFLNRLPALGHRNWIAIVDSAYPEQTSEGIETVVTYADQLGVVEAVLEALAQAKHVRPIVYVDAELPHVPEADAKGIEAYRKDLAKTLGDRPVQRVPHGEIINKLDAAGAKFRVLVLKTNLALPYTSVFIELDCAYWSADAEQRLRAAMSAEAK